MSESVCPHVAFCVTLIVVGDDAAPLTVGSTGVPNMAVPVITKAAIVIVRAENFGPTLF